MAGVRRRGSAELGATSRPTFPGPGPCSATDPRHRWKCPFVALSTTSYGDRRQSLRVEQHFNSGRRGPRAPSQNTAWPCCLSAVVHCTDRYRLLARPGPGACPLSPGHAVVGLRGDLRSNMETKGFPPRLPERGEAAQFSHGARLRRGVPECSCPVVVTELLFLSTEVRSLAPQGRISCHSRWPVQPN